MDSIIEQSPKNDPLYQGLLEASGGFEQAQRLHIMFADEAMTNTETAQILRRRAVEHDAMAAKNREAQDIAALHSKNFRRAYYSCIGEILKYGSPTDTSELSIIFNAWSTMLESTAGTPLSKKTARTRAKDAAANFPLIHEGTPLIWKEPMEFNGAVMPLGDTALSEAFLTLSPKQSGAGVDVNIRTKGADASTGSQYPEIPIGPRIGLLTFPLEFLGTLAVGEKGIRQYLNQTDFYPALERNPLHISQKLQDRMIDRAQQPYKLFVALAGIGLGGKFPAPERKIKEVIKSDTITAYGGCPSDREVPDYDVYANAARLLRVLKDVDNDSYRDLIEEAMRQYEKKAPNHALLLDAARLEGMADGRQNAFSFLGTVFRRAK